MLLGEFVAIIRNNISPANFICINNPAIISVCINDTTIENTQFIVMKITDMIEELVMNNFENFNLSILYNSELISKTQSFDKQIQNIIKELVEKT